MRISKHITKAILFACIIIVSVSCKAKYGCPSDGRNVGAEKLASGDPKAAKAAKKAPKFKGGKFQWYLWCVNIYRKVLKIVTKQGSPKGEPVAFQTTTTCL